MLNSKMQPSDKYGHPNAESGSCETQTETNLPKQASIDGRLLGCQMSRRSHLNRHSPGPIICPFGTALREKRHMGKPIKTGMSRTNKPKNSVGKKVREKNMPTSFPSAAVYVAMEMESLLVAKSKVAVELGNWAWPQARTTPAQRRAKTTAPQRPG